jgi:hypothetical protein
MRLGGRDVVDFLIYSPKEEKMNRFLKVLSVGGLVASSLFVTGTAHASSSDNEKPAVDWGYEGCPAGNTAVYGVGVVWSHPGYYGSTVIRAVPSGWARYGDVLDDWTPDELGRCLPAATWNINSWQGIYDQFDCHDVSPGGIGTGPTWDLEGHRPGNRDIDTWIMTKCSWE